MKYHKMKYQQMKWISLSVLIMTIITVLALKQLDSHSPEVGLKPISPKVITAKGVAALDLKVNRPMGVTLADELVAVADAGNKRVIIANMENQKKVVVEKTGEEGELSYPVDVAFDPKGFLYVADMYSGRVVKYDEERKFNKAIPDAEAIKKLGGISPSALTVDKRGRLYVTDVGMQRVVVFDREGKFLFQFGKTGSEKGQFLYPNGIAVNNQTGDIYVADTNNSRIQIFDGKGVYKGLLPLPEGVAAPRGIEFIGNNELVFVSTLTSQLYQANVESGRVKLISLKTILNYPNDVAVGGGKYYVADRGNDRLLSFSINYSEVKRSEK